MRRAVAAEPEFECAVDSLDADAREARSSPFAEGPADEKENVDPFWDFGSVDWLPLRLRRMYFSIASASRSRMREAIAAAGLGNVEVWDGGDKGWWGLLL